MCFGGGGGTVGGGTIHMPDTSAFDKQFDAQVDLMKMQQEGAISAKQRELDKVLRNQTAALAEIRDARVERANEVASVEAEARRMSNLIGTPPPEPTASAPVIGRDREKKQSTSPKGKRGLRITQSTTPTTSGSGAGLNINTNY